MAINISKIESVCGNYSKPSNASNAAKPAFGYQMNSQKGIKFIKWLSDGFTSADQRLLRGVTCFMTQPFFDLYNKKVDDKTRTVSCARTIGKSLAGTITGVSIRWILIKAMNMVCNNEATENAKAEKAAKTNKTYVARKLEEISKTEKLLLPEKYAKASLKEINKYKNAVGTLAATFVFIFTNFLIDAPLTTFFTNKLTKHIENGTKSKENEKNIQKGDK